MNYRIGETSKKTGLPESTLRYYEKEGIIIPDRTETGLRTYNDDDINWLKFINHMRSTGMSISDLSRYVKLRRNKIEGSQAELLEIMKKHKKHLEEKIKNFQINLEIVNYKINMYESELSLRDIDLFDLYKERGCIDND